MKQFIAHIALVVKDYDEAIEFYCRKLGFRLIEDTVLSDTKDGCLWRLRGPVNAHSFWQKPQSRNKCRLSAIKLAGAFFYFCSRTILPGLPGFSGSGNSFCKATRREDYVRLPFLKIYMEPLGPD
jgi:catechol 2,3-dioxygenase-like lactoylglutathione lyase family enzyme